MTATFTRILGITLGLQLRAAVTSMSQACAFHLSLESSRFLGCRSLCTAFNMAFQCIAVGYQRTVSGTLVIGKAVTDLRENIAPQSQENAFSPVSING